MTQTAAIWGTKEEAVANARRLLSTDPTAAVHQANKVIEGDPRCAEAHRILGLGLRRLNRNDEAKFAEENAIKLALLDTRLFEATMALMSQQLSKAERLLRNYLQSYPDDASALRMLAEVAARTGHFDAAESMIHQALAVAPEFAAAKNLLAAVIRVRERDQESPSMRSSVAIDDALDGEEIYREAIKLYEQVVTEFPDQPENWISYGYVLRIVGRQDEALEMFRRAIALRPSLGEAWWAIADLKSSRFATDDVAKLRELLESPDLADSDRTQLNFAIGRALEQFADHDGAFRHYAEGNRVRARTSTHDPAAVTRHVDKSIAVFGDQYFSKREGCGDPSPDPIFVLGMPRAGSTLLEQILSSHPDIEGVNELPDIPGLADWLGNDMDAGFHDSPYLDRLVALPGSELLRLGRGYIWNSGLRRRTMKPFFVDKMPNNWLHLGLILSIVPNAKIVDARRNALACGFSNFRQYFVKGQDFSYDLAHIGRFYADYVRMMAHFDALMPGRIHRVDHEQLVAEPEAEIRRLLAYLEVGFDERCLRFHENRRAVPTASSEQVRKPINPALLDEWRPFEPYLGPLAEALGALAEERNSNLASVTD